MKNEQETIEKTPRPDTWTRRRLMMWTILWFCIGIIVYCLGWDPKYGETAIEMSFSIIGIIIMGYVFGAVLDDNAISIFKRK